MSKSLANAMRGDVSFDVSALACVAQDCFFRFAAFHFEFLQFVI
jgi:hypothetical protein